MRTVRKKSNQLSEVVKISIRAFAKQINVSEGAIRKAIKGGRFEVGYDSTVKKIDPVIALKNQWVKQQGIIKPKPGISRSMVQKKLSKTKEPKTNVRGTGETIENNTSTSDDNKESDPGEELDTEELINSIKITTKMDFNQASKLREFVALALDKKKLQEVNKILISREKVERTLYAIGNELKKSLFNMPQRVVRRIMDAGTEVDGITILNEALTNILTEYGSLNPNLLN